MEAAGLAIGVVGLIGAFKDCVDVFSLIAAAQELGRDYEIANVKLDVEKTLLLQWAERVRLIHGDYDERLDDLATQGLISRILSCITMLLTESGALKDRYGLRQASKDDITNAYPTMSGPRMAKFIQDFESMKIRVKDSTQTTSVLNKARWVIVDKEKFGSLISDLSYFMSKLNEIVPASEKSAGSSLVEEDVKALRSLQNLQLVASAMSDHEPWLAELAKKTIGQACEDRILNRIWFRSMDARKSNIQVPHSKTFEWAMSPREKDDWDDMTNWFRSGSNIFWISGKAGSGKSTLMKYIVEHSETKKQLAQWAGADQLHLSSFFFWSLGSTEQNSQEGLLRALLYHILIANPSRISELLPGMWKEANNNEEETLSLPSIGEMRDVFHQVASTETTGEKFCFFIDGLDEYSGNYQDAISIIKGLCKPGHIKAVVSSRPIPSCVEAFSQAPKVKLQDLTRDDIRLYVHDTLGTHPYLKQQMQLHSDEASELLEELVSKASGVFLWVVLAARSLQDGFAAYDRMAELRARIDELPPELEDLFRHMLDKVEFRYRKQAAKIFRIMYQKHVEYMPDPLPSLGLSLIDQYDMDLRNIPNARLLSNEERQMRCNILEGRLRSRCGGLLEIIPAQIVDDFLLDTCFCGMEHHDTLIDSHVEFMHRTMFEFLDTPSTWELDCLEIDDEGFDADAALAACSLHLAEQSLPFSIFQPHQAELYLVDIMKYLARADRNLALSTGLVLDKMEKFLASLLDLDDKSPAMSEIISSFKPQRQFLNSSTVFLLAVEAHLTHYVQQSLITSHSNESTSGSDPPFLHHAIARPMLSNICKLEPPTFTMSPELVRYLLMSGQNPNERVTLESGHVTTPWLSWLQQMTGENPIVATQTAAITEVFLEFNVDLNIVESSIGETLEGRIKRQLIGYVSLILTKEGRAISAMGDNLLRLLREKDEGRRKDSEANNRDKSTDLSSYIKRGPTDDGQQKLIKRFRTDS